MRKRILSLGMAVCTIVNMLMSFLSVNAAMNIEIGEYVEMGTYYGKPILWRCVDIDENGPLMLSDKIICLKAFDASGINISGSHGRGCLSMDEVGYWRRESGSNNWGDSNIRCWLNSTEAAGNVEWLCGNPPDEEHVYGGYNEYEDEAGFLTNFTEGERSAIKTVTQKSLLDWYEHSSVIPNYNCHQYNLYIDEVVQNYETAYSEQITDKMFLLDVKQIYNVYNNESILGKDYYIGELTAECVEYDEHPVSYNLVADKKWHTWLRSPANNDQSSSSVRYVDEKGYVQYTSAYGAWLNDVLGVRPAFYLNLSAMSEAIGTGTSENPYKLGGLKKTSVSLDSSDEKIWKLNISVNDLNESAEIYVGLYIGNILKDIKYAKYIPNETATVTFDKNSEEVNARVFVWKNGSLEPLTEVKDVAIPVS